MPGIMWKVKSDDDDKENDDDDQVLATGTVKHPSVRETARRATMSAGGMTAEMVT